MRSNPKHGNKTEYQQLFAKYTKVEKIRRFLQAKRPKIYKNFMLQAYHNTFTKKNSRHFVEQIDTMFKMAGKLIHFFVIDEHFHMLRDDDRIPFEVFFEVFLKWALNQEKMSYEDFAMFEDQLNKEEEVAAFKKMTDRIV
jgi:hypothetical protein